jgi:hypothetical protein
MLHADLYISESLHDFESLVRRQVLERHNPAADESDHFPRIGDARRDVRPIEWVVKGATEKHERPTAVMMHASPRHADTRMAPCHANPGVSQAVARTGIAGSPWTPRPGPVVRIIWVASVIDIDPGLRRGPRHVAHDFLIG